MLLLVKPNANAPVRMRVTLILRRVDGSMFNANGYGRDALNAALDGIQMGRMWNPGAVLLKSNDAEPGGAK